MTRKTNPALAEWRNHVKAFADKNGLNYREALKDPRCKNEWHKNRGTKKNKKVDSTMSGGVNEPEPVTNGQENGSVAPAVEPATSGVAPIQGGKKKNRRTKKKLGKKKGGADPVLEEEQQ